MFKRAYKFKLKPTKIQQEKFLQFAGARRWVFNRGLSLLKESPKGLARAISDAGWRLFLHCLKYKAEEQGKHFVETGKYFPSSQLCSNCNGRQKMPLTMREYHCQSCGYKISRDYNSAIVQKTAGMSVLKACGAALIGGNIEAGILRL